MAADPEQIVDSDVPELVDAPLEGERQHFLLHYRRGETLLESGHYEDALRELKQAVIIEPAFSDAYVLIARIHEELGNYDDAVALYEQLRKELPSDLDVATRLAGVYERVGNGRKAISLYKKVLKQAPMNVGVRCQLAKCHALLGRFRRARWILRGALKQNPACSDYLFLLGEIARQESKLESAHDYYEQCLEFDPNHAAAKRGISYVIRAMDLDEGSAKPRDERDEAFEDLRDAVHSMHDGQTDLAIVQFQELLSRAAVRRQAMHYLGLAYVRKGLYKRARDLFYELSGADVRPDALVLFSLGLCSSRLGEYEVAIRAFQEALEEDPGYAEALMELGWAYQLSGDGKHAKQAYLKTLKMAPDQPRLFALMARFEFDAGRRANAHQLLQKGFSIDPASPDLSLAKGYMELCSKRFADAMVSLQLCLNSRPYEIEAHKLLGAAREAAGDLLSAVTSYREAYRLNPGDVEVRRKLEKLEHGLVSVP